MNFPSSVRGLLRLRKKFCNKYPNERLNGLCPIDLIAFANGKEYRDIKTVGSTWPSMHKKSPLTNEQFKMAGLECGFENYTPYFDNATYRRYYKVGQSLRQKVKGIS